jgi:hypothetical protein
MVEYAGAAHIADSQLRVTTGSQNDAGSLSPFGESHLLSVAKHAHFFIDEAHEVLHAIQNRLNLQLNGWPPRWRNLFFSTAD